MSQDRTAMLFFELFNDLPRQGPGDTASTLRALALVPGINLTTRVLDLGCGTGMQTRVLAEHSPARILAIDNHPPFVDEVNRYAAERGIGERLEARVGDMQALSFPPGSFDVIWCEGAIYVVGFDAGLQQWFELLAPGGHMAVTEACWTKPDPPPECLAFWNAEYPSIRRVDELLRVIDESGYDTVGHFTLPPSSWWDDYYRPLQGNVLAFRERHHGEDDARSLADSVQREIDIWKKYSEFYSYEFFVMRRR